MTAKYRENLPCLAEELYITDAGIETVLIFEENQDLPSFAAFTLLKTEEGTETLRKYYRPFVELANANSVGCILESATWRASPDWGTKLGFSADELESLNQKSISILRELRQSMERDKPVIISGCVGPRGDGYVAGNVMSVAEATEYHSAQVAAMARAGADLISGITMTCSAEAAGLVAACQRAGMPVVIAFTVETDGSLPSGESLKEAIGMVEGATSAPPQYYMLNCAHPAHFEPVLQQAVAAAETWPLKIKGLRANASTKSHAELDEATELDAGDPIDLGKRYRELKQRCLPTLSIVGGCCGTNVEHVTHMCTACLGLFR